MSTNLCSTIGGNTGNVDCATKRGTPKKIVAGSKAFTSSDYIDAPTFQAALLAACKLEAGNASKLFPFPDIGEIAVNTEADTIGNLTLGPKRRLRKGRPAYTYSVEISHYQYQKLLAFDAKIVPVFTFDDKNNFWGYRAAAAANTPNTKNFTGELAFISVSGNGFEDGNTATVGVATIQVDYISIDDFEKRGSFMSLPDLSTGDLVGLKDVMLSEPQAHASNVYKIKMTIPVPQLGADLNIFDDFGAAIAALTFTAFTGATFSTPLPITSIAVDSALKCLTVTFDSATFTGLSGGAKIKFIPPTPTVLDGATVTGIEIGYIILTK